MYYTTNNNLMKGFLNITTKVDGMQYMCQTLQKHKLGTSFMLLIVHRSVLVTRATKYDV